MSPSRPRECARQTIWPAGRHALWRAGLAAGALGFAAGVLLWPRVPILTAAVLRDSRPVFCARTTAGQEIVLSFIHSVNKRPVYDTIRVEGDHLRIVKSRYDSFGAGMPEASVNGGTLNTTPDGWLEWVVDRPVPEVSFFVGWVAEHALHVNGRTVALKTLVEPGTLLALRAEHASWYRVWKERCVW